VQVGHTKIDVPLTITREGGLLLRLEPDQTLDFSVGTFDFDISAPIRDFWQLIAKGTLVVSGLENISPLEDARQMEIRFKKGEDYRVNYDWEDFSMNDIIISDAYMQAKDVDGNVVMDLRWYPERLTDQELEELPGEQKGYLVPVLGEYGDPQDLELYVSHLNTVPPGVHKFDLFVRIANSDWKCISEGTVVVEPSVSVRPA
jgi:hypothetical protein